MFSYEYKTKGTCSTQIEVELDGDIVKEFAKDNLLFSQTLQEWTVHTGVDIKAEKTTVVRASTASPLRRISIRSTSLCS